MSTLNITLTPKALHDLLAKLEQKAQDFQFRAQAFKGHNIHIAAKASRELKETEQLIIVVKNQLHLTTYGE